jgi:hypothetical protein
VSQCDTCDSKAFGGQLFCRPKAKIVLYSSEGSVPTLKVRNQQFSVSFQSKSSKLSLSSKCYDCKVLGACTRCKAIPFLFTFRARCQSVRLCSQPCNFNLLLLGLKVCNSGSRRRLKLLFIERAAAAAMSHAAGRLCSIPYPSLWEIYGIRLDIRVATSKRWPTPSYGICHDQRHIRRVTSVVRH